MTPNTKKQISNINIDPTGPVTGDSRVIRSGSWRTVYGSNLRSASRHGQPPFQAKIQKEKEPRRVENSEKK